MSHANESQDYKSSSLGQRAVFGASLAAVLPVAMVASMSGWRWQPWPPGSKGYQGALREATLTARNLTAIAFSVK
ncbi:MAG: hypothetical protein AB8G16_10570 [Gammaproteobacteria bacterium]